MKKRFLLFSFILGGILFGSIGVFAAYFNASDIIFTPNDSSWEVSNVKEAMDSLYTNVSTYKDINTRRTYEEMDAEIQKAELINTVNFDGSASAKPTQVAVSCGENEIVLAKTVFNVVGSWGTSVWVDSPKGLVDTATSGTQSTTSYKVITRFEGTNSYVALMSGFYYGGGTIYIYKYTK